ncbi:MAG: 3-phenylpropionate/cinnamic acid dioxygenase subunit beta [Bowdeniella nasicola]|nr:3-phenylpropionate/cinnamic acid dioxygenase subunit beta [Bowdeniella nasicola]
MATDKHVVHAAGAEATDELEGTLVDLDTWYRLQQFYFYEAELLDDGRFADWLEIFDEDLHYWAPTRSNRTRRQQALSIAKEDEAAFYDETKDSLAWRIRRFDSGMAWAEDPPSRTRHLISNLTARHHGEGEILARTNFIVWRSRLEREQDWYAGERRDIVRVGEDGSFKVANRFILFDINVLMVKNISTFF